MKNRFNFIAIFLLFIINANAQGWKATGALAATGSPYYLTGATNVGNDVFALSYDQNLVYSSDLGVTWSAPKKTNLTGKAWYILGIENRLYISTKANTYDNELHYSTDKGLTWKLDTVGLPLNIVKSGKDAMNLIYMGNGYVLAHNYAKAFYKKVKDTKWKLSNIEGIVDVAATKDKWLIIGGKKIMQSTNNGESWTQISTTGLPDKFQGSKICTNGTRVFISNAPATGGQDIYYSDNGGSNWTKTNSAGKYTHANPWVNKLYAVEDYVFAAIVPKNIQDAAPFLVSSTKEPDFSVGDVSGMLTGVTTTSLPFFFHVKNKLFTMMWDLFSSEPGFSGESDPSTKIDFAEREKNTISIYPNPASQTIQIKAGNTKLSKIAIISLTGKKVLEQNPESDKQINISQLNNGVYFIQATLANGQSTTSKFIKN